MLLGGTVLVSGRVSAECARGLRRLGDGSISEGLRRLWDSHTNGAAQVWSDARHADEWERHAVPEDR